jgi:peptidoglycan hydrolase-like protein with peptidoglycan-binding domain
MDTQRNSICAKPRESLAFQVTVNENFGLAVAGFVALAGCSSGASHPMTQSSSVAPAATTAQSPLAAVAPEVSPGLIKRIQTSLKQQRLYKGLIDGVWGPQTQRAIHSYQQSHNLTANGELDSATLASLKIASVDGQPPVPVAMAPAIPPVTAKTTTPPASATE